MIHKIVDWVAERFYILGGYLVAVTMLIVCYDVTARYLFGRPTVFAQDFAEYLMVYSTFLAAGWLLKQGVHVRIGILTDRLRPRAKTLMQIGASLVGVLVCLTLLQQSVAEIWNLWQGNVWLMRPLSVPKFATRLPISLGSLLLLIYFVEQLSTYIAALKGKR